MYLFIEALSDGKSRIYLVKASSSDEARIIGFVPDSVTCYSYLSVNLFDVLNSADKGSFVKVIN